LREPLILFDLQGLPYAEVASALSLPLRTVKSRIKRGRTSRLAKRLLSDTMGFTGDDGCTDRLATRRGALVGITSTGPGRQPLAEAVAVH